MEAVDYMNSSMKFRAFILFVVVTAGMSASAVVETSAYHTGILVHARSSQSQGKNCVVLTLVVESTVLVAEQCATLPWNAYVPSEFTEQGDVQVRIEQERLLLRRPNGKDLRARIVRKALLQERVNLKEYWKRNAQDREEGLFAPDTITEQSTGHEVKTPLGSTE